MEDSEIVQEFLIESNENLARLDQEMVELERQPKNIELLSSVFRTIHTIKGTCGFLGFQRLGALAHVSESILSELRDGKRDLDTPLTSLILDSFDGIKRILRSIEASGGEGETFEAELLSRLECVRNCKSDTDAPPTQEMPPASTEPPVPQEPGTSARGTSAAETTLRVDVGFLDRLMNLVGELVLTRNQVLQHSALQEDTPFNAISQRLNLITTELQEAVMKSRMQPIGLVWSKLPRVVRDLAASVGKEIELEMEGAGTELDRTIIEAIKDPLTHIVRNSCDHGIESPARRLEQGKLARGRLSLRAFHEGGQVNIEIADDGAGIDSQRVKSKAVERGLISVDQAQRMSDRDAINLVFLPGFSTAETITSISGRGVGMDVVRTHIERIGGTVDLISEPGRGTTVRVRIPLTLAIIPGLVVTAGGERFVIPQIGLHELIRLEGDAVRTRIEHVHATPVFRHRDVLLPLADLNKVLGLESRRSPDEISLVVLQADGRSFGLILDSICDSQEIVVKPLGLQVKGVNCYAGATIMGDGGIALILDVMGVGVRSGVIAESGEKKRTQTAAAGQGILYDERRSLLLFRAGSFERLALPLSEVARLEEIPASGVERAAGRPVVQYRGGFLPLISLAELLGGGFTESSETLQVVVYRHGSQNLGLVVDQIVDIVEEVVVSPCGADQPGLLGSGVVGGKVTDFLDLEFVASRAEMSCAESLIRLEQSLRGVARQFVGEEVVA
jgi:two-component system, chemotaxis family, sensor kinase CheA